jgi:group I intron endonuclease
MPTEKIVGVYAIVNTIDNKAYIGRSIAMQYRWSQHRSTLRNGTHRNLHLQHASNKSGADAFDYRILEIIDDKTALPAAEWRWIVQWETLDRAHGYNLRSETQSPTFSPETRQKLRDARRLQAPASPETRQRRSDALKGRIISPEHRQKISYALKGRKHSPEALQKMRASQRKRQSEKEAKLVDIARSGEIPYNPSMKIYRAKPEFDELFARVGLSQIETARLTETAQLKPLSVFTLAHVARRRQNAGAKTAHRIAKVYAEVAGISQDAAITLLFDEVADRKGPTRQRGAGGQFVPSTGSGDASAGAAEEAPTIKTP